MPRHWGGVTRRGAAAVREGAADPEWRRAADRTRRERERAHERPRDEPWQQDTWVREDDRAPAPRQRSRPRRQALPDDVLADLARATSGRPNRLTRDLTAAAAAFEAGRYQEAQRYLKPLAERAPTSAAVRELLGLTLYRMGRWNAAIAELEAFHQLTGSVEHEPVVADCERALGRHAAVERRWEDLRRASPPAEVLGEGRLVMAGDLADRGELDRAIALLARYEPDRARPRPWHVRTWYALADLYERAGDVPRARGLFQRLVRMDPEWFDAAERLAALQ
ncbi:MAG TPA: tetratricopeptide repeat protein [Acidimicrobiales bacterium]|nr:tetratricopeptide repeat protein [Acidimicrobiales bacterium]